MHSADSLLTSLSLTVFHRAGDRFFYGLPIFAGDQLKLAREQAQGASQAAAKAFLDRAEEAGSILGAIILLLLEAHDPEQTPERCDVPSRLGLGSRTSSVQLSSAVQ